MKTSQQSAKRIAVICDFDETFTKHDSFNAYLKTRGVSPETFEKFRAKYENPRTRSFSGSAFANAMVDCSNSLPAARRFTRASMAEFGRRIEFVPGVETFFERVRQKVGKAHPGAQVEFHLVSGGLKPMIESSRIAKQFATITASDPEFDDSGRIRRTPGKRMMDPEGKVRAVKAIAAGSHPDQATKTPPARGENLIFVGDGLTDQPAFEYVMDNKGKALCIFMAGKGAERGRAEKILRDFPTSYFAEADYRETGAASDIITGFALRSASRSSGASRPTKAVSLAVAKTPTAGRETRQNARFVR